MSTRNLPAQIGDLRPVGRPAGSALLGDRITTLAQVAAHRRRDLLDLHGGRAEGVSILRAALAEHGLTLAGE